MLPPTLPIHATSNRSYVEMRLSRLSDKYIGYELVQMPPRWGACESPVFTFVLFRDELRREELHSFLKVTAELGLPNPRAISRPLLELASLFHPLFYMGISRRDRHLPPTSSIEFFRAALGGCRLKLRMDSSVPLASPRYYLQSMLFLAGCTLSAAVIQNRFSAGTVESKLSRLWQASQYAKRFGYGELQKLNLDSFVVACDSDVLATAQSRLTDIKKQYGMALASLLDGVAINWKQVEQEDLSRADKDRFGFVDWMSDTLGQNLQCILVYGSAVTSQEFTDYDLVLMVRDSHLALRKMAGTSPKYKGKDLNLSVYDAEDFCSFQSMSGDNLDQNARCIYGQAEIPIKPANDLLVRNLSFAFIRLRQLLGMAGFLAQNQVHVGMGEQTNLYEYFVKIPMHIMKGVRSVVNEPISKEFINAWTLKELQYDLVEQMKLIQEKQFAEAIANAYFATQSVIDHLNKTYNVFERVTYSKTELAQQLASLQPSALATATRTEPIDFV